MKDKNHMIISLAAGKNTWQNVIQLKLTVDTKPF